MLFSCLYFYDEILLNFSHQALLLPLGVSGYASVLKIA